MSQIATDQIEAAIRKTGNTHPSAKRAPQTTGPGICADCVHFIVYPHGPYHCEECWECCHFYADKFERRAQAEKT